MRTDYRRFALVLLICFLGVVANIFQDNFPLSASLLFLIVFVIIVSLAKKWLRKGPLLIKIPLLALLAAAATILTVLAYIMFSFASSS